MRIAYLLESTEISGGVKVVLLQSEALARRGHTVTVVSPDSRPAWFPLARARFERASFRESAALGEAEVRVATFWTTVAPALADARGPVFHLCQGYEGAFSFYADRRSAIEEAYRSATRKLAISSSLARRLEALGFGPVENVGQAFDATAFTPSPVAAGNGCPTVLLVGPYEADVKGIAVALDGLDRWRRQGARFRVRRVSTLPPTDAEKGREIVDEYHQRVPPDRMPHVYRSSDVFIGPSRTEEGFGLPTLEALACGVPCLLSDTPGNVELAAESAWYFRDGDPESLAEAMPRMITADARRLARERGPVRARAFDPESVARRLEAAFRAALDRST